MQHQMSKFFKIVRQLLKNKDTFFFFLSLIVRRAHVERERERKKKGVGRGREHERAAPNMVMPQSFFLHVSILSGFGAQVPSEYFKLLGPGFEL